MRGWPDIAAKAADGDKPGAADVRVRTREAVGWDHDSSTPYSYPTSFRHRSRPD